MAILEANGKRTKKLSAPRLVEDSALQPGLENVQFRLGHCPLEAEKKPVVEMSRIVEPVLIEDQGIGERAHFKEPMPIGTVTREPAHLQAHHDPGMRQSHLGNQVLKSQSISRRCSGLAQIVIDHHDLLLAPPKLNRALPKGVLTLGALGIFHHLPKR